MRFFLFNPPQSGAKRFLSALRALSLLLPLALPVGVYPFDLDQLLREKDGLDFFKKEYAVERCDLTAQAILLRAEGALSRGDVAEAISLGEAAARFSPETPLPHFFLAQHYFLKIDLLTAAQHYFSGLLHAFNDFWFLFSGIGIFLAVSLAAFLLSLLIFALCSLFYIGQLWVHEWTERLGVSAAWIWGLYGIVVLLPLILGLPLLWFVSFCFFLSFGFYHRAEKGLVVLFLIIIGSACWILPLLPAFFIAKTDPLLNEMAHTVRGISPFAPQPQDSSDWRSKVLLASHATRNKAYHDAETLYREALLDQARSPLILNNLGNVYFYLSDYEQAIAHYQQALQNDPESVLVRYNMSQAYRGMLLFEEGEKSYAEALSMNRGETERYTKRAIRYPALSVVEARFTHSDLWRVALTHKDAGIGEAVWRGWAGGVPLAQSPWIALAFAVLLPLSSTRLKPFHTGRPCAVCRQAICGRCEQILFNYTVCPACAERFSGTTHRHLAELEWAGKQVPGRVIPFFLIPGCAQIVLNRTVLGFSLLCWSALLGLLCWSDALFSSVQWRLHFSTPLLVICLFLVYAISTSKLIRRAMASTTASSV